MPRNNDWKKRSGVVYSTSNDFEYNLNTPGEQHSLSPDRQKLKVTIDRSFRAGKQVTVISGFQGPDDELTRLEKNLKTKCGVGGSSKDGVILIQGDLRQKIIQLLKDEGYGVSE